MNTFINLTFVYYSTTMTDPEPELGGHMVSAECEPITGVWGQSPMVRGLADLSFCYYHNLRSWQICPEICFFVEQKIRRDVFGGHGLVDPPQLYNSTIRYL